MVTPERVKALRATSGTAAHGSTAWHDYLDSIRINRFVVLDDLAYTVGRQLDEWVADRWDQILRVRKDRPTIITTNYTFEPDGETSLAAQLGRRPTALIIEQTTGPDGRPRRFDLTGPSHRGR